ncbi:hypothetical protein JTB14_032972 [Gonioctena quinquepunctata]|nr:hypothetical protein JTB14_032972 [Gonioctena quinquepunctata]
MNDSTSLFKRYAVFEMLSNGVPDQNNDSERQNSDKCLKEYELHGTNALQGHQRLHRFGLECNVVCAAVMDGTITLEEAITSEHTVSQKIDEGIESLEHNQTVGQSNANGSTN